MNSKFIDYSLFSIVNSIISQNNELDRIVEELLIILLNKFEPKHVAIYIKHKFKNEVIKFNKAISKKGSEIDVVLVKSVLNSIISQNKIIVNDTGYMIPLVFDEKPVGVLHFFYGKKRISFCKTEMSFLQDLANHIAQVFISLGSVENIIFDKVENDQKLIKGVGASKGISWGKIFEPKNQQEIVVKRYRSDFTNFNDECALVEIAVKKTIKEIKKVEDEIRVCAGEDLANIFVFHQTILKDPELLPSIKAIIGQKHIASEYAVIEHFDSLKKKFENINDHIVLDLTDIEIQIINIMQNNGESQVFALPEHDFILIAEQILPSDIIKSKSIHFKGMIEGGGGPTSHASILAKSLNIPLIYGVGKNINLLREGEIVIVDSASGIIVNRPSDTIFDEYKTLREKASKANKNLISHLTHETKTTDGISVRIGANIGVLSEVAFVPDYKAEYIGLYRTEMPFLIRQNFPTEEQQFEIYKKVITGSGVTTTIRTLDIGGDKAPKYLNISVERNPVLGKRSIRVMFDLIDEFKSQIKAIFRAGMFGKTKVMFPMISSIEEILKIKEIIAQALFELDETKIKYSKDIEFGVMIEIPSAIWIIDDILKHVDFVSVGTNDLIQYTIAIDRDNNEVFHMFNPLHPAIIRSLKTVSVACKKANKDAFVCGEMASDPISLAVLIGLGFTNLSMSVHNIPQAKEFITKVSYKSMVRISNAILKLDTSNQIEEYLLDKLSKYL